MVPEHANNEVSIQPHSRPNPKQLKTTTNKPHTSQTNHHQQTKPSSIWHNTRYIAHQPHVNHGQPSAHITWGNTVHTHVVQNLFAEPKQAGQIRKPKLNQCKRRLIHTRPVRHHNDFYLIKFVGVPRSTATVSVTAFSNEFID